MCSHQLSGHAVAESGGEVPLEIVAHLRFQLNAGMDVDRHPASQSNKVPCGRGLRESKIFGERAHFNMVAMLLRQQGRRRKEQRYDDKSQVTLHGY